MGNPGQRVHDQQDILALVTIVFSNGCRPLGTSNTQQRGPVRRHRNNGSAFTGITSKDRIHKSTNLTATLTNHPDDDNIGRGIPAHHPQQNRFTDAGASDNTDALAHANGQHRIDHPHTNIKWLVHWLACQRVQCLTHQRPAIIKIKGCAFIQRVAKSIGHTTKQPITNGNGGTIIKQRDPCTNPDARTKIMKRQQIIAMVEADHLGNSAFGLVSLNLTERTYICRKTIAFNHLAIIAADMAVNRHRLINGKSVDLAYQHVAKLIHQ